MYKLCVIGCGEIGFEVMKAYRDAGMEIGKIIGKDISPERCKYLEAQGFTMTSESAIPEAETYVIAVWSTDAILDTVKALRSNGLKSLVFIESTIDPSAMEKLEIEIAQDDMYDRVVIFPHRFNPNDPNHHVFNLDRLMATFTDAAKSWALLWLEPYMDWALVHHVTPDIAILSKVTENAYRAMEIILAQELKKACFLKKINFNNLRNAVNTKWNIDLKDARDGVKGKCLPKDLALFTKYFDMNLADMMEVLNNQYVKDNEQK